MTRNRYDDAAELKRAANRLRREQFSPGQESTSLDRGRFRVGQGEFVVDEDGRFTLQGVMDQTGIYNLEAGGRYNVSGIVQVQSGGNIDIEDGGNLNVSGDVTVRSGGELTVNGPVPMHLRQYSVAGAQQAAMRFGDQFVQIYGRDGVLMLQAIGSQIVVSDTDGIMMQGIPTGTGTHYLGIDAAGKLVRLPAVGDGGPGDPGDPPTLNPEGYIWPADPARWGVSDTWAGHRNRNPPSAEPGTDVACPYGTPIYAPADCSITNIQTTPESATGRFVEMRTDGDAWFRTLHLSRVLVTPGQHVTQGTVIALSGGSGFGSDTGYGPHCHVSFWSGPTTVRPPFFLTEDFQAYMAAQDAAGGS